MKSILLISTLMLASACARNTQFLAMADVRDGAMVRLLGDGIVTGRAVGFGASGVPRLVTARGDTMTVPAGARIQFLRPEKRRQPVMGALLGFGGALVVMMAQCGAKDYCGEQNPAPVMGILFGGLAGLLIKTNDWGPVR